MFSLVMLYVDMRLLSIILVPPSDFTFILIIPLFSSAPFESSSAFPLAFASFLSFALLKHLYIHMFLSLHFLNHLFSLIQLQSLRSHHFAPHLSHTSSFPPANRIPPPSTPRFQTAFASFFSTRRSLMRPM